MARPSHVLRNVLLLLGAVALANALSISRNVILSAFGPLSPESADVNPWGRLRVREDPDEGPPCDRACRAPAKTSDVKRSLEGAMILSRNVTLEGRTMTLPSEEGMDDFMLEEVPKADSFVWRAAAGDDMNTAILKTFDGPDNRDPATDKILPLSVGTSGLCGCTSLVIVSRKGVYATHYWENISFSPDPVWRLNTKEKIMEVFERTVTRPLREGEGTGDNQDQAKLDPTKLDDDNIRAYLVHPDRRCGPSSYLDGYRRQWDAIKTTVGEIIPALKPSAKDDPTPDRWKEIIYQRQEDDDILFTTAAGHVLFKFDPDHEGKKKAALWSRARKNRTTTTHGD